MTRGSWHPPRLQARCALCGLMVSVILHFFGRHWTASETLVALPAWHFVMQVLNDLMSLTAPRASAHSSAGAANSALRPPARQKSATTYLLDGYRIPASL